MMNFYSILFEKSKAGQVKLSSEAPACFGDLNLDQIVDTVTAGRDEYELKPFFYLVLDTGEAIAYRQEIMGDLEDPTAIVREIYALAVETVAAERKLYFSKYPAALLHQSNEVLQMFCGMLKKLRTIAIAHAAQFQSAGFTTFWAMINQELSDQYFGVLREQFETLKLRDGALISAELGPGNQGQNYIFCASRQDAKKVCCIDFSPGSHRFTPFISPNGM